MLEVEGTEMVQEGVMAKPCNEVRHFPLSKFQSVAQKT